MNMDEFSCLPLVFGLTLAPLFLGVINRTKAWVAGRRGQPLLQAYYDLWRLLHKGAVYSRTTTWIFRAGPVAGLAAVVAALALMPFAGCPALVFFPGDLVLFAGLLGVMRFGTMIAALDTGSSFEGMGASREAWFGALAEPVLWLSLAVLVRLTGQLGLSSMQTAIGLGAWSASAPELALVAMALFAVFLAENSRIPVDDPNTHLELTMVHEVMVLDHSGPDFAFIQYAAALKHWVLASLLAGVIAPVHTGRAWIDATAGLAAMAALAVATGLVESAMARLRLARVPQLLVGAGALGAMALMVDMMK